MFDQEDEFYEKDGVANTLPGIVYQVKMSMLLFKRAMDKKYEFRIAAERKGAGKFDDLEIKIRDTNVHRLYQLKHVEDETKNKITKGDLVKMDNSRFSWPMYFTSYRQIKDTLKSSGMSYEFVIFTNIGLHKDLRESFEDAGKDELLDMKFFKFKKNLDVEQSPNDKKKSSGNKKPIDKRNSERLKLKKDCAFRGILKNLFKNTSDLVQLKTKLIDCIKNKKVIDFKDKTLKKYQKTLLEQVLDEKNEKIHSDFLASDLNLSEGAKELRSSLLLEKFEEDIANIKIKIKKCNDLFNAGSQAESKTIAITNDQIDDEEINDFLDKLVLAVNQPNETELNAIIEKTIGDDIDINLINNDLVASALHVKMEEWTKMEKGSYLTPEKGEEMFKTFRETISKLALIGLTSDYCKKLNSFSISFQDTPPGLHEFLKSSERRIFHLKNSDNSLFSSIKVSQYLQSQSEYDKDDSFVFSPLENLQRLHKRVLEAFESNGLLIIELNDLDADIDETFASDLLEILSGNTQNKLMLISKEDYILPDMFLNHTVTFEDKSNSFDDLSEKSKETLLSSKEVSFQGYLTPLTLCVDADILFRIMNNERLEIGSKLPDLGEVDSYYVPRRFQKILLRKSILEAEEFRVAYNSVMPKDLSNEDIILISEAESVFETMCNQLKNHTIHWIEEEQNLLVWKKSHGSNISKLRKYLFPTNEAYPEETNIRETESKFVIITAPPGMGKSTELTRLANEIKTSDPSFWVLRVNLIDCSSMLAKQRRPFDNTEAMQFLDKLFSSTVDDSIRRLEKEWFQKCLEQGKVIVLFDGFDEISPSYNAKVMELLKTLKDSKIKQMWITTRPYGLSAELEDQLLTFAHSLQPLEDDNKREMMLSLWKDHFDEEKGREYANKLIDRFSRSTKDWRSEFFGSPLLLKIVATVFLHDTSMRNKLLTDTNGSINLAELYQNFFDMLFNEHIKEKHRGLYDRRDEPSSIADIEEKQIKFEESYKRMALYTLFGKEEFERLLPGEFKRLQSEIEDIDVGKHKMGIVERVTDNKPVFVHRTLAEFFVARCLTTEYVLKSPYFGQFMRDRVFEGRELVISRFFIHLIGTTDYYKSNNPIHAAVFRNDASDLKILLANIENVNAKDTFIGWSALQCAALCQFWDVAELLLQRGADKNDIKQFIKKISDFMVLLEIAVCNNLVNIVKFCDEINTQIQSRVISDMILNRFELAICKDSVDVIQYMMDRREVSVELCTGNSLEEIVLFDAARNGSLRIVKHLLETGKVSVNIKDGHDRTPLLIAVEESVFNVVEYLVKVENVDLNILNENQQSLMQIAVENNADNIVECLVNTGKFNVDT
jgi:Ankyrin repeats (3 copies)/NACHT domain